jgi:hypothetical protein
VIGDPDHPLGAGAESELFCLATTLVDEHAYPVGGFPDLYHDRWQLETAIGDMETRLRGGADVVLRSQLPDLVRQEVYGLLCVYQAVRTLMNAGAEHAGLDPDRISFTRAKQAAARHLSDEAAFSPDALAELVDDVIYEITDPRHLLPAIKRQRAFAREQKRPSRRYRRQQTEYKQPLPPRTMVRFWPLQPRDP